MKDVLERLKKVMIERLRLNISPEDIAENTPLFGPEGIGLDSVDVLELIVGIKSEFGIEITDRETAEKVFVDVGTVARFIKENL